MGNSFTAKYGLTKAQQNNTNWSSQYTSVYECILQYRLLDGSEYESNVSRIRCFRETGESAQ